MIELVKHFLGKVEVKDVKKIGIEELKAAITNLLRKRFD